MKKNRKSGSLKGWLKKATLADWLIIAGIAIAAITVIVLSIILFGSKKNDPDSSTDTSSDFIAASNSNVDNVYDKDTEKIDKNEYTETILEEASDAGQSYVDETLFIGDSNTVRMMSYGHTTLANDVGAVSMGIQHVASKAIVFFKGSDNAVTVPKAVQIIQPKRIVITYGTNNTIGWTAKTFVDEYKKALNTIQKAYPYADIIINCIPPVDKVRENPNVTMQTIDAFNSALAKMAKAEGYKFLNSSEALKDEKHGFAKTDYTISDGIHLSKKGMDALFEYIRTHPYETEDKRPKPLKKIPARNETPPGIITEDPIFDRTQKQKKGIKIQFVNETPDMGVLEGKTEQTVEVGKTCETVKAVPLEGFALSFWSCTVGKIENTSSLTQNFVVPSSTEKILVAARFEKAYLVLSGPSGGFNTLNLEPGNSFKPTVGFTPASYSHSRDFAAVSDNQAVAAVAADGTITAVGAGTCTVTYSALSGKLSTPITVTVSAKTIAVTDINVTGALSVETGKTGQIAVNYVPENATNKPAASFVSDNTTVATVDANGVVTGVASGTAKISITVGNVVKTCTITVTAPDSTPPPPANIPLTGISVTSSLNLNIGGTGVVSVTFLPADATNKPAPAFSSSDSNIAAVDGAGNVTAVNSGSVTITVTAGGFTSSCTVTVNPSDPSPPPSSPPPSSPPSAIPDPPPAAP